MSDEVKSINMLEKYVHTTGSRNKKTQNKKTKHEFEKQNSTCIP